MTWQQRTKEWWHSSAINTIPVILSTFRTSGRAVVFVLRLVGRVIKTPARLILHSFVPIYTALWRLRRFLFERIPTLGALHERTPRLIAGTLLSLAVLVTLANVTLEKQARPDTIGTKAIVATFSPESEINEVEREVIEVLPPPRDARSPLLKHTLATPPLASTRAEAQALALPSSGGPMESVGALIAPTISVLTAPRTRNAIETYLVQSGDTLSKIAQSFGLSIETLLWANRIRSYQYLRPGDKLLIPPMDGVVHIVKRGETLEELARIYRVSPTAIAETNRLENQKVAIGTTLIIPGARPLPPPAPPRPTRVVERVREIFTGPLPKIIQGIIWPTAARRISQYFKFRHPAIDIAGPVGTPIYAADDGVVIMSQGGWNGGYGRHIRIDHGEGRQTRYGHMSKLLVQEGDRVTRGQLIGLMGSTGRSTGPHLHFEYWIGTRRINPLAYVK